MMRVLTLLSLTSCSAFVSVRAPAAASTAVNFGKDDLKTLATELNPVVGYWDPLGVFSGERELSYCASSGADACDRFFIVVFARAAR